MKIKDTDLFCHYEGLRVRTEENDEITIYDRKTDQIHTLNSSATYIFRLIKDVGEISKIFERYKNKYDITSEKSKADVVSVVQKLIKLHLIRKM